MLQIYRGGGSWVFIAVDGEGEKNGGLPGIQRPITSRLSWQTNYWFSHEVTKIQTKKLSILPCKRVIGFVIEYACISKLLRDAAFT